MPTSEPVAMKPSASPRWRGRYISVAATRNCWPALMPLVKMIMPSVSPMALPASIARPETNEPISARPCPNRMPGLRP